MELDIQFGDVEETPPETRLRPDRNKHYAVAAVQSPSDDDLPIFVDVDVLREMESHAQSDTTVELGGVLLGGQYLDDEGRPFVLITDSLRAQHFEATKGSFKFTHDTWSQISRERDEFPSDLQMVGWYHTHPDWGVFLSGMDMFICDNFFNKPLDVALVIDPCRGDRGMFQWTGDPKKRIRRTDGFYLTASRFRQFELEWHAAQYQGEFPMPQEHRYGGVPPMAAPVVNIAGDRQPPWQMAAVMGMLSMQFLLVALLAWKLVGPPTAKTEAETAAEKRIEELEKQLAKLTDADVESAKVEAQKRMLDRVLTEMNPAQNRDVVELLEEAEIARTNLANEVEAQRQAQRQYQRDIDELQQRVKESDRRIKDRDARIESKVADLKTANEKIAEYKEELKQYRPDPDEKEKKWYEESWVMWTAAGALLVGLAAMGVVWSVSSRKMLEEEERREAQHRAGRAGDRASELDREFERGLAENDRDGTNNL